MSGYTLPEVNDIIVRAERLEDQVRDLETELDEAKAEINELRAQLNAKEEGATTHRQIERRAGTTWVRDVTIIAPEWEALHENEGASDLEAHSAIVAEPGDE